MLKSLLKNCRAIFVKRKFGLSIKFSAACNAVIFDTGTARLSLKYLSDMVIKN